MATLPNVDLAVLLIYGAYFARDSRTPEGFTMARGRLSSWLVGLSLFGTYLSNTFLGVLGHAPMRWTAR